jgi:serine/threonine protein kinase
MDEALNARLSDFNASGYNRNMEIGPEGSKAIGAENASHFMPRDHTHDNTLESDLFALGSTLSELITGKAWYEGRSPESVENPFRDGVFPIVDGLPLDDLIMGCLVKKFRSAKEMLKFGETAYGL